MKDFILRTRWLLSALLLAGAALLAIGAAAERGSDDHHDEAATTETAEEVGHDEAAEEGEHTEATATAHSEVSEEGEEGEEEELLGVNVESIPLVVAGVLASVALAIGVWLRRDRWLLWTVAGLAVAFVVFDVAEFVHQIDENRTGIAIIAASVAVLHFAAAAVAETRATSEPAGAS
jgi:uncharacterized low-complexity protein